MSMFRDDWWNEPPTEENIRLLKEAMPLLLEMAYTASQTMDAVALKAMTEEMR